MAERNFAKTEVLPSGIYVATGNEYPLRKAVGKPVAWKRETVLDQFTKEEAPLMDHPVK